MAGVPLTDNLPFDSHSATAGQTVFSYTFWVEEEADLDVYVNGVLKTLTTDYTIDEVQNDAGSPVRFTSGLAENDDVVFTRTTDMDQLTGYTEGGSFPATGLNLRFARLIAILQEVKKDLGRTMRLASTSDTDGTVLVSPEPENGTVLGWLGGVLSNVQLVALQLIIPSMAGKDNFPVLVDEGSNTFKFGTAAIGAMAYKASVDTAELDDNSVTLPKMAGGTAGKYLGFDGSGDPAELDVAGYLPIPQYLTASTISVGGQTVNIGNAGALGLEAASAAEGTDHPVFLYECKGASGTTYVFSRTNEDDSGTITAPAGYDVSKTQFPFSIYNDASGNFMPFKVVGWGERVHVKLLVETSTYDGAWADGDTNEVSNGTAGTPTDVDFSAYCAPWADRVDGHLLNYGNTSLGYTTIQEKGGTEEKHFMSGSSGAVVTSHEFSIAVDSSQVFQYTDDGVIGVGLDCMGWHGKGVL